MGPWSVLEELGVEMYRSIREVLTLMVAVKPVRRHSRKGKLWIFELSRGGIGNRSFWGNTSQKKTDDRETVEERRIDLYNWGSMNLQHPTFTSVTRIIPQYRITCMIVTGIPNQHLTQSQQVECLKLHRTCPDVRLHIPLPSLSPVSCARWSS